MANMNQQMLIYSPNQVLTCYIEPKITNIEKQNYVTITQCTKY